MSYEPTVWQAGDTVTSAKLNKLEQGLADNITIIPVSAADGGKLNCDMKFKEIYDYAVQGSLCIIRNMSQQSDEVRLSCGIVTLVVYDGSSYVIKYSALTDNRIYSATGTQYEYPVFDADDSGSTK